jgi:hypothetical protein
VCVLGKKGGGGWGLSNVWLIDHAQTHLAQHRRQWHLRSIACGGDATWGALDVFMRELGVAQTELEPPEWVALDVPIEQRCVRDSIVGFVLLD